MAPRKKIRGLETGVTAGKYVSVPCVNPRAAADDLAHALDNAYLSVNADAALPDWNVAEIVTLLRKLTEMAHWGYDEKLVRDIAAAVALWQQRKEGT